MINRLKKRIKDIDLLLVFLLIFTCLAVFLALFIRKIYQDEVQYNTNNDSMYELISLNKTFDNFLLNKREFINLDSITKNTKKFEDIISKLKKNRGDSIFFEDIRQIESLFFKKRILIEKFKSYNALSIYSLSYIIDISKALNKEPKFKNQQINNITFEVFQLYLNINTNTNNIKKDIQALEKIKNRSALLTIFIINVKSIEHKLSKINQIKTAALKIPLLKKLKNMHQKLDILHEKKLDEQITTSMFVFILLFILLIYLFILNKISRKNQFELKSFKYAVENSDDSIVITDTDRHITYVNEAFTKSTGYSFKEAMGKNPNILKSGKLPQKFYDKLNDVLNRGKKWSGDFINIDKKGHIYYEKASITPMFTKGKLTGYLAIKLNISDYLKEQKKTEFLAYHDNLTNLPNRRMMKKIISEKINKEECAALCFLDLDGFKNINDTLGHDIGDLLLRKISKKIQNYFKNGESVFRTGGDEFAILLTTPKNRIQISNITKDILSIINEPIQADKHLLKIGASIGIAEYKKESIVSLLKHADIAMYEAKQNGKNRYKFYTKKLSTKIRKKMEIEKELETALQNGEFYVVYQPKYNLKTKKFKSVEALIRWQNPKLGLVSPAYFIPIAEEMAVINDIGKFVFKTACQDFIELQKISTELQKISINVSAAQLLEKNIAQDFIEITKELGIETQNIGLEITETHIMNNIEENIKILTNMRKSGFYIIIDDFGTGYSSMSYLKKLPITNIKIDKSFIDDICIDSGDLEIVKATIAISKSFNYDIVAEGVETEEQEKLLLSLGVKYAQGYHFSKPKTKEELSKFLLATCRG